MTINEAIERIEAALLDDSDEPGITDTETGEFVFTEIGTIRLRRILTEFRKTKKKPLRKL